MLLVPEDFFHVLDLSLYYSNCHFTLGKARPIKFNCVICNVVDLLIKLLYISTEGPRLTQILGLEKNRVTQNSH